MNVRKIERTAAKKFVVRFWNFAKNKNFLPIGEQITAAQNDVTAKIFFSGLFQKL